MDIDIEIDEIITIIKETGEYVKYDNPSKYTCNKLFYFKNPPSTN